LSINKSIVEENGGQSSTSKKSRSKMDTLLLPCEVKEQLSSREEKSQNKLDLTLRSN